MLVELIQDGRSPYAGIRNNVPMEKVMGGYQPPRPAQCSSVLYSLMQTCWAMSPAERPMFTALVVNLKEFTSTFSTNLAGSPNKLLLGARGLIMMGLFGRLRVPSYNNVTFFQLPNKVKVNQEYPCHGVCIRGPPLRCGPSRPSCCY